MTEPAGIYIHVPFCAVKCPYCAFFSRRYNAEQCRRYTQALLRNIAALPEGLQADTLYFGGGTPSLLPPELICRITEAVRGRIHLRDGAEITLEANPLTVTEERLQLWRACGVNRLSVGVQSFSDDVLKALGRRHSAEDAKQAILLAKRAGFRNISADIMLGLADVQHLTQLQGDYAEAQRLGVSHISMYMLKIEEDTPFSENHPPLMDDDTLSSLYLHMHDDLTKAGMRHYEISNYALPGAESRHNCKYWRCVPYYGLGPGAHSFHGGKRFAAKESLSAFFDAPVQEETVTEEEAGSEEERAMLGLRIAEGIAPAEFPETGAEMLRRAAPLLGTFLCHENGRLFMTPRGWLVSNTVLAHLLA